MNSARNWIAGVHNDRHKWRRKKLTRCGWFIWCTVPFFHCSTSCSSKSWPSASNQTKRKNNGTAVINFCSKRSFEWLNPSLSMEELKISLSHMAASHLYLSIFTSMFLVIIYQLLKPEWIRPLTLLIVALAVSYFEQLATSLQPWLIMLVLNCEYFRSK